MRVIFLEETDSTNAEIIRRWYQFPREARRPHAVVAEVQKAGRGREERPWTSPRGGLWFSLAWPMERPVQEYQTAPLLAGAVTARLLQDKYELHPLLKWPNDIHVANRKIGGILCQTETRSGCGVLVIGIGLNINFPASELGDDLRTPAVSYLDVTGKRTDTKRMAEDLAERLGAALAHFEHDGIAPWINYLNEHLAMKGQRITCEQADGEDALQGRVEGIDSEGRLLLLVNGRIKHIRQGEITTISNV